MIHHRGQLGAYIRPMGGKVPSIYGPSGDDPGIKRRRAAAQPADDPRAGRKDAAQIQASARRRAPRATPRQGSRSPRARRRRRRCAGACRSGADRCPRAPRGSAPRPRPRSSIARPVAHRELSASICSISVRTRDCACSTASTSESLPVRSLRISPSRASSIFAFEMRIARSRCASVTSSLDCDSCKHAPEPAHARKCRIHLRDRHAQRRAHAALIGGSPASVSDPTDP